MEKREVRSDRLVGRARGNRAGTSWPMPLAGATTRGVTTHEGATAQASNVLSPPKGRTAVWTLCKAVVVLVWLVGWSGGGENKQLLRHDPKRYKLDNRPAQAMPKPMAEHLTKVLVCTASSWHSSTTSTAGAGAGAGAG
eukprot:CAMPEP_0113685142 /NCGR_PEP_ID=MMETSP0038_2-20120614/14479_1 /TAXON_ID=2898 /ORGANISM="Cryptomonas paramecium" /LENGTH=138 /DNA_ID=CAMNT_0000605139 /DNA_START=562 /DNA_END=975 /DNA_ORIENTATION=+ /assembly_acc=CAM_ASM_000170